MSLADTAMPAIHQRPVGGQSVEGLRFAASAGVNGELFGQPAALVKQEFEQRRD